MTVVAKKKGKAKALPAGMTVAQVCAELQALQRQRAKLMKIRIAMSNSLVAAVAYLDGYVPKVKPKGETKKFGKKEKDPFFERAKQVIAQVREDRDSGVTRDEPLSVHRLYHMIWNTLSGLDGFGQTEAGVLRQMEKQAAFLPAAAWSEEPDQLGLGVGAIARIVGEAGDLSNYANPGKLWKRFGLAPITHGGRTLAGSTWRYGQEGKLTGEAWEDAGYSPRRRSVIWNVVESALRQNQGPYRRRYLEAKESAALRHPDWGKRRCHLHAQGMAAKLVLKRLWGAWNPERWDDGEDERRRLGV